MLGASVLAIILCIQILFIPLYGKRRNLVRNELLEASYVGDVEKIQTLLTLDPSVLTSRPPVVVNRAEEDYGRTAVMVCGFDPQTKNHTKLDRACAMITQMLHEAGGNLSVVDREGWDALSLAAMRGLNRVCKYLVEKGRVNIDHQDHLRLTAAMKAATNGFFGTASYLLQAGANALITDRHNQSMLHHATSYAIASRNSSFVSNRSDVLAGYLNVLDLMPPEAIDIGDQHGRTALMYAAIGQDALILSQLLEKGADPRLFDGFGVKVLDMVRDDELRELLLEHTARRIEKEHNDWLLREYNKEGLL
eukprot:gene3301-3621_t